MARYEQIPADSIYKRRAKPRYDEARTLLVAEHMAAADKARAAGRCADVRPRSPRWSGWIRATRSRRRWCGSAARAPSRAGSAAGGGRGAAVRRASREAAPEPALRGEPTRRRAPSHRPSAPSRAAGSEAEAPDPDALMKQAREAWLRQQCGSAIDLSRKALHAKPGMTDAYQIIAVCSCTLKDADAASRAYAKLDDKNRNLVRALCQKNGVTVGE